MAAVLLVHGAWHGSWCWDDWCSVLESAGHRPVAVALRGHDRPGSTTRLWHRLGDYVADVRSELRRLGPDTVVVGHSMGGLVVQRALEKETAALGVLLASVPVSGVIGATVRTARRAPAAFLKANAGLSMYPIIGSEPLTRAAFFGDSARREDVLSALEHLQNESYLAYLQMFTFRPRPERVTTPIKVVAAQNDAIFSLSEERNLAAAYGTEPIIIEGAGHDLMLDPAGRPALDALLGWLGELDR